MRLNEKEIRDEGENGRKENQKRLKGGKGGYWVDG